MGPSTGRLEQDQTSHDTIHGSGDGFGLTKKTSSHTYGC